MGMHHYTARGGSHPHPATESVEIKMTEIALEWFSRVPRFARKGLRWTYNLAHFRSLWMTKNPELRQYLYRVRPYPSYVEVETTTRCDFSCLMCEHTYWDEQPRDMSLSQFRLILDQFPELKWIGVTGIGQSFLNPAFPSILDQCHARGLYVEQYDNFHYMDPGHACHAVDLGLERVFVSLDAATRETYQRLRPGGDWERVLENVLSMDAIKRRYHSPWPELCFHYVVCQDNVHEVVDYVKMVSQLGVQAHSLQFSRMLHPIPQYDGYMEIDSQLRQQVMEAGDQHGLPIEWNADVPEQKPPMSECTAWQMPFIFVDGTVIPCCALNEQNDRAWQREHALGNVFEQPFSRIWYGERYTAMLDQLMEGSCPPECARCPLYEEGAS
jgi:MoaA/NifB/PqqE/SkfB family radical SAM enzyme